MMVTVGRLVMMGKNWGLQIVCEFEMFEGGGILEIMWVALRAEVLPLTALALPTSRAS